MTAVAALAFGSLALAPTAANASIVACPSMHISYNIYGTAATATCYDSHGNIYYNNPGNLFRIKLTCTKPGSSVPQYAYGSYSNWRSSASCNSPYEIAAASIQYSTAT